MQNVAIYIAGDENIIIPSLVYFNSVKKYNNYFDLYIFTDVGKIDNQIIDLVNEHHIILIDFKEIKDDQYLIDKHFGKMHRWPKEIFYNYIAPIYLANKGYKIAVKADYDLLCMDSYEINQICPSYDEVLTIVYKSNLSTYMSSSNLDRIDEEFNSNIKKYNSVNAGFIVLNLDSYVEKELPKKLGFLYQFVVENNFIISNNETPEQFCLGCLQGIINHSFKQLPGNYNYRPLFSGNCAKIKNLHFNSTFKPWTPIDAQKISVKEFQSNGSFLFFKVFLFYNLWLDEAAKLNLNKFIKCNPYSPREQVEILRSILKLKIEFADRKSFFKLCGHKFEDYDCKSLPCYFDKNYNWVQFKISSDGFVHYEIYLNEKKQICCALHFEGCWGRLKRSEVYSKIKNKFSNIQEDKNGFYLTVDSESFSFRDPSAEIIHKIGCTLKYLIDETYTIIQFYLVNKTDVY